LKMVWVGLRRYGKRAFTFAPRPTDKCVGIVFCDRFVTSRRMPVKRMNLPAMVESTLLSSSSRLRIHRSPLTTLENHAPWNAGSVQHSL
jgi:hypothetical protein